MKYKAADKTQFTDKDAQLIGTFIEKTFPNGVKPKELVDAARPRSSPIHKYFTWDDSIAAENYRLQEARKLVSCLIVEIDDRPMRAFHNVRIEKLGKTYVNFRTASANEDLWDQVIAQALNEVRIWKQKYQTYQQFKPIFMGIQKVERKISV